MILANILYAEEGEEIKYVISLCMTVIMVLMYSTVEKRKKSDIFAAFLTIVLIQVGATLTFMDQGLDFWEKDGQGGPFGKPICLADGVALGFTVSFITLKSIEKFTSIKFNSFSTLADYLWVFSVYSIVVGVLQAIFKEVNLTPFQTTTYLFVAIVNAAFIQKLQSKEMRGA